MWRLLTLVSVCASLWGASLLLPVSDGEQQLRSIVSIAVQQPVSGASAAEGDSLTVPVNRAYLPEGAADAAGTVDVKALVGSKPVRPAKVRGVPADTNKAATKVVLPQMVGSSAAVPAPVPARRPVASALAEAKPVIDAKVSTAAAVATQTLQLAASNAKPVPAPAPVPVAARRLPPLPGIAVKAQQALPGLLQTAQIPAALEQTSNTVTLAVSEPPKNSIEGKTRRALTRAMQRELVRIGCLDVGVTGDWDEATRSAMNRLNTAMGGTLAVDGPDSLALSAAQLHQGNCGTAGASVKIAVTPPAKQAKPALETLASSTPEEADGQAVSLPVTKPLVVAALDEPAVAEEVPAPASAPEMLPEQPTLAVEAVDDAPAVPVRRILKRPPLAGAPALKAGSDAAQKIEKSKRPVRRLFVAPRRPIARPDPRPVKIAVARPARQPARTVRTAVAARLARPEVRAVTARADVRAKPRRQTVLAARKPRKRPLIVARRYPTYQILQASLFRPLVVLRRSRFERVRTFRRARPLKAWEYGNGIPGLPKYLR